MSDLKSTRASERASPDLRAMAAPFDIIGDVHGACDELELLLSELGYRAVFDGEGPARRAITSAPAGRTAVFVGDLVDRGPRSPANPPPARKSVPGSCNCAASE